MVKGTVPLTTLWPKKEVFFLEDGRRFGGRDWRGLFSRKGRTRAVDLRVARIVGIRGEELSSNHFKFLHTIVE